MTLQQDLKSKLTTRNLAIMGAILIIAGNAFSLTVLNVRLHELLANVGALILVIGILQWFFDEDSRRSLIDRLCVELDSHLSRRDGLTRLGITDCVLDSKALISEPWASELIGARVLAIGTHYSDGVVARFEAIIKMRIGQNKVTQVLHSEPNGPAKEYLENCLSVPVDLPAKVKRLQELVSTRFSQSPKVRMVPHRRVLRYSFIFSERALWIVFITNSDGYEPMIPAIRISGGSALFEFFKRDVEDLGVAI